MEPIVQGFRLPKLGNSEEEFEDAFAYSVVARRFAMADGATESSFADRWAQRLVCRFVDAPPFPAQAEESLWKNWIEPQQREWHASIPWDRLTWFAEEKARAGATATLLGVEFKSTAGSHGRPVERASGGVISGWSAGLGRLGARIASLVRAVRGPSELLYWDALAIGDTCLFQLRGNRLLKAFPLERSSDFNNRPFLISSAAENGGSPWSKFQFAAGVCWPEDVFLLVTDALAQWALARHEAGNPPWETLCALKTADQFKSLIDDLRRQSLIKNDDMSMIVCRWEPTPRPPKPAAA